MRAALTMMIATTNQVSKRRDGDGDGDGDCRPDDSGFV